MEKFICNKFNIESVDFCMQYKGKDGDEMNINDDEDLKRATHDSEELKISVIKVDSLPDEVY